ncbi:MAG: ATP-grasp domain-containing protein [Acidobacteriota bacterium]|jgi:D-alanine-D-alanine ligase|nr:ATP-grasp domain-containing protein [Acidobacteriota bacterium]
MTCDCAILHNAATETEKAGSREVIYASCNARTEVGAIAESLRHAGYSPCVIAVGASEAPAKGGVLGDLIGELKGLAPKFVFNLLEEIDGDCGMEMAAAGLLELMQIPFTGSDSFSLGLALRKYHAKLALDAAGVPVPRGVLCAPGDEDALSSSGGALRLPLIVKPVREDASLGVNSDSVCRRPEEVRRQVGYVHEVYRQEALVEEYIDGREFNVSVIGGTGPGDEAPEVLAIAEIDFSGMPEEEPKIVSYRAKWDEGSPMYRSTTPVCPAPLSRRQEGLIKEIAIQSYQVIGCRDYGRVDMRMDAEGSPYVLEVNPNPDLAPEAGFARAVRASGRTYQDVVLGICRAAMARGRLSGEDVLYAF